MSDRRQYQRGDAVRLRVRFMDERRAPAVQVDLSRPLPVLLDGQPAGRARNVSVRVRPDALTVVV